MLKSVRARKGALLTQTQGGCIMHSKIIRTTVTTLALGVFSLTWAQPGAVDVQTQSASELNTKYKTEQQRDKEFELVNQDIFGEGGMAPHIWHQPIEIEDLAIDLDRDFSDYLVANLDRERVETFNQEN